MRMNVWLREAAGRGLLGVGLAAFAVCYFVFLFQPRLVEAVGPRLVARGGRLGPARGRAGRVRRLLLRFPLAAPRGGSGRTRSDRVHRLPRRATPVEGGNRGQGGSGGRSGAGASETSADNPHGTG